MTRGGFQPLTIITKSSILDVAAVLDPPLLNSCAFSPMNRAISVTKNLHHGIPELTNK